jgi:4-hydroxybutyrate CoA-transferase
MRRQYEQQYRDKMISASKAAELVGSNMIVHLGGSANVATIIDKYLAQRKAELANVTLCTYLDTLCYQCCQADPSGDVFKWYSGFILGFTRKLSRERGIGIYRPSTWHNVPSFLRSGPPYDIFFLVTAPMDANGYFNFGLTVAETMAIAEVSRRIVVVVRPDMPTLYGGDQEAIHISRVDHIVEDNEFETFCLPLVEASEKDRSIATTFWNRD